MKKMGLNKIAICILGLNLCSPVYADDSATSPDTTSTSQDVDKLLTVIKQIQTNYVQPISEHALFQDAMQGMVSQLEPHSSYLDETDLKALNDTVSGEYAGLGIELTQRKDNIVVIDSLDDSPAKKAGIKSGDILLRINNQPLYRMPLANVIQKLQGKAGTSVNLTFYRSGQQKLNTMTLTRQVIRLKSVKGDLIEPGYGYMRIAYFQENTPRETKDTLYNLLKRSNGKLSGLILDLRGNPGGLLDASVEVADSFISGHRVIVTAKGRTPEAHYVANDDGKDLTNGAQIVVLIDEGTASGAEIVAGALQDYNRAIIMGTPSFGKGSVQTVIPLDDTSALKLTTAYYYTPKGRSIQAEGIQPDIVVKPMELIAPKPEDEAAAVTEAQLEGHLPNATPNMATNKPSDIQKLMATDYQTQEAFNVLRGLTFATNSETTSKP